jgi:hypothetical protein
VLPIKHGLRGRDDAALDLASLILLTASPPCRMAARSQAISTSPERSRLGHIEPQP